MQPHDYRRFIDSLRANLEPDPRVLGVLLLGSTAEGSHPPDEWSDHDFWVIVKPGEQPWFREHRHWLPDADAIVFSYRETEHGLKAVYQSGHVAEYAVFDLDELRRFGRVNDGRVLLDRAGLASLMPELRRGTPPSPPADAYCWGQLIAHAIVGVGRCRRGEILSGTRFIKLDMVSDLLPLIVRYRPSADGHLLDNLDVSRRFEFAYPDLGAEINAILLRDPVEAAYELLRLAERELRSRMPDFPTEAFEVGKRYVREAGRRGQ